MKKRDTALSDSFLKKKGYIFKNGNFQLSKTHLPPFNVFLDGNMFLGLNKMNKLLFNNDTFQ